MTEFSVFGLTSIINRLLPEPHAGLLSGLLFGTKAALSPDFYNALVQSGTIHIIALSGMNISILGRIITSSLTWVIGKRRASFITICAIIWFVWFVGPSATIVRAAIMGGISILALVFGRQYWGLLSWILAVAIMLLFNFSWFFDVSFQLSTMATLGIILFGNSEKKIGENPSSRIKSLVAEDLRLTFAAMVFTIPIVLFHFRRISLVAPIANLLISWSIPWLTGLGWITVLVGWVWFPISYTIAWIDWLFLEYLVRIVHLMGSLPFAGVTF